MRVLLKHLSNYLPSRAHLCHQCDPKVYGHVPSMLRRSDNSHVWPGMQKLGSHKADYTWSCTRSLFVFLCYLWYCVDLVMVCRMVPQSNADVSCIAFTIGTALLAVQQWLQDLRCALRDTSVSSSALSSHQEGHKCNKAAHSALADFATRSLTLRVWIHRAFILPSKCGSRLAVCHVEVLQS